ncbi:hypothetical protein JCGZ_03237 [Jatropha curcas]|uniref:BRCT domain-containing protein n=2 Tax=Jatropha curcas TaxID=180498 RepID=A0A067KY67_JATCU|nr:hypothetical protein JCGZ_03237 [Jatropha curcas]
MVIENGGTFSMNLNKSVTHCIAAENKGIKYQAAKLHGDVIHCSWVLDCCSQKKLLPLQPKYFLFLSEASKKKLQEEIDEFSDSYYWDIDLADIKQLLENINASEDANRIEYYKRKYCPKDKWSLFYGCSVYFYLPTQFLTPDWETLLGLKSRRLKLEVLMGGGYVSNNLANATHMLVLTVPGISNIDFDALTKSFTGKDKYFLLNKRLSVIGYQWLEDSLEKQKKLEEETYSLKPSGLQELNIEKCNYDLDNDQKLPSFPGCQTEEQGRTSFEHASISASPKRDVKRKRGGLAGRSVKKGKAGISRARKTQTRVGKPAKICEYESDENNSSDDETKGEIKMSKNAEISKKSSEIKESKTEESESSHIHMSAENEVTERREDQSSDVEICEGQRDEWFDKTPNIAKGEGQYGKEKENSEKLEVMVDPVHAMLLDMIPGLGMKKMEKPKPFPDNERPAIDPTAPPAKKKKVSYKDIAGELLKD